jgi:hypothetical protein
MRPFIPAISVLLMGFAAPAPVSAAEKGMTMFLRNQQSHAVVIEFHGRKTGTVWPGDGQIYLLDKLERKSVTIGCQEGENVCYGAWANGDDSISFGVGPDDDKTCTECCRICVEGTTETVDIGQ